MYIIIVIVLQCKNVIGDGFPFNYACSVIIFKFFMTLNLFFLMYQKLEVVWLLHFVSAAAYTESVVLVVNLTETVMPASQAILYRTH